MVENLPDEKGEASMVLILEKGRKRFPQVPKEAVISSSHLIV